MKNLIALLTREHPFRFALAILLGVIAGASTAGLIAAIHRGATDPHSQSAMIFLAVAVVANIVASLLAYAYLLSLANEILAGLRAQLARSILAAPYEKLEEMGSGALHTALTDDIQSVGGAANAVIIALIAATSCVGAFVYVATLSPIVCIAVLIPIALGSKIYITLVKRGQQVVRTAMQIRMRLMRAVSSAVSGAKELKMHAPRSRAFFSEALSPATRDMHETLHASYRVFSWGESLNVLMFFFVTGAILFLWPLLSPSAADKLPAVALAILFLPASITAMFAYVPVIVQGSEAVGRLEKFGLALAGGPQDSMVRATVAPWSKLELKGVTYKYRGSDDREFSIGPIDLTVHPGEMVFVTGGNGSGKTTLAKIIVGLYTPDGGERAIDGGVPTDAEGLAAYRAYFSAVFVDCHVFDRFYGATGNVDAKVTAFIKELGLEGVVSVSDGVLSTADLSQGQRKRLALLFALVQDRPIFVLDEWAAEQDPTAKKTFYETILPTLRAANKTIIVITHDDHYVHVADRVVRVEDGKLRELDVARAAQPTAVQA